MSIHNIIEELNLENGSNYKLEVLKKHQDNEFFQRVVKMAYDKVDFTYGLTLKSIDNFDETDFEDLTFSLEQALDLIEDKIASRKITGHAALRYVKTLFENTNNQDDLDVLRKIINRDLKTGVGTTLFNKIWKDLITKPSYMRCGVFSYDKELPELDKKGKNKIKKGTHRNIDFPAILQLKADGTYREFVVDAEVTARSRSGESYQYPIVFDQMQDFVPGVYTGELTVILDNDLLQEILPGTIKDDKKNGTNNAKVIIEAFNESVTKGEKYILPRAIGNGLINSSNPPHNNIIVEFWDFITHEEYAQARLKDRKNPCVTPYEERWNNLNTYVNNGFENIKLIPTVIVDNMAEVGEITSKWMNEGFEGAVLKDYSGVFKDGTSLHQLKIKVAFEIEVRILGFLEGTPGTKREETFGSMEYQIDSGEIKGSVTGFNDKQLQDFNSRREELISQIMTIQGNDLTKARNNDYHAVSHPRFIELRDDRDSTDTLERSFELLELAKQFKNI